jgi:OOP family OmpA-OmpF porin
MHSRILAAALLFLLTSPLSARAQDAEGDASASVSASTVTASRDNFFELGLFAGIMLPSAQHNLEDSSVELGQKQHRAFKKVAPDFGARIGYYPVRYFGIEFEGAYLPTGTKDGGSANLWALRGHGVGQIPFGPVTPFVLVGGGRLGANSDAMGKDSDPAVHFGMGAKLPISKVVGLRFDFRDSLTQKDDADDGKQTHHLEFLLGVSFSFGLSDKPPPSPSDRDGDGFVDEKDDCPDEPGVAPRGCPKVEVKEKDTDGDGIVDPKDLCPTEKGLPPDGCPDKDSDKDGVPIPDDKCPTEPGPKPDGCPDKDPDQDGVLDPDDKCPTQPETKNGFQDVDGCPDELPAEVKKFTGTIQGIEFDFGKATIRPKSKPTLDAAAKVLTDYPELKIEISGHTDNVGPRQKNVDLSQARADSVKAYLVDKGISGDRIQTRGAGPDEHIADNKTAANRQKNRRIEFKLLTQ